MYSVEQVATRGFHYGAPSLEAEEIDVEMAARMKCRKCGGSMRYEGYHKNGGSYVEYVALAVCNDCGHEVAF
jgi:hypothetical protein